MAETAVSTLTLLDASSVIFDKKWSTDLPVVGRASVELKILYAASKFTFSITVQVAGKTFNWSKDVSGNITIPIKLVDGFGLELDIAGWAVSAHQLSFDLLVKITGPFGFSVILHHDHVKIPLPGREQIEALAAVDFSKSEHASLFMRETANVSALGTTDLSMLAASPLAWGWTPPWKWSGCAKCKLEVYAFLSGSVAAAIMAADGTPPGVYAAVQALLVGEYGEAVAQLALGAVMGLHFDEAASIICKATGKC